MRLTDAHSRVKHGCPRISHGFPQIPCGAGRRDTPPFIERDIAAFRDTGVTILEVCKLWVR